MNRYKNNIGKTLVTLGTFISGVCALYTAFSSNFILGVIVLSIIIVFLGLYLTENK